MAPAEEPAAVVFADFTAAMLIALSAPRFGFALICAVLIQHLPPELRRLTSR